MVINRDNIKILLIILVLGLGIGYAYINSDLNINGTAQVNSANWDIHWSNIQVTTGSVSASTPTISNQTTVNYSVVLNTPGDYYEFTVDAVNGGSIDAMIDTIDSKLNGATITTLPAYLKYTVTYSDGVELEPNHQLLANTTEKYKVRIEYRTDIELNQLPATNQTLSLEFTVTYRQANEDAVDVDHILKPGVYFTLVPDSNSYTITSSITGYSSNQIITPSELSLWRVIKRNDDGTIDAVSEYVSSTDVYLNGVTGFANFVGALQTISQQFSKTGYTINTRSVGYDGQTLTISDTSSFDGTVNRELSHSTTGTPTSGVGTEYNGGLYGDTLYLKDYLLINNVYGNLIANKVGTSTATAYWISSRLYVYGGNSALKYCFNGRRITNTGGMSSDCFRLSDSFGWEDDSSQTKNNAFRPIITLRPNISIADGNGTKGNPYTFK